MAAELPDPPDGETENERAAQEYLTSCYLEHRKWLMTLAHKYGKGWVTSHDAWDLSQTVFLRFYDKVLRDGLGAVDEEKVPAYLGKIIKNLVVDELRSSRREREVASGDIEEESNARNSSGGRDDWGGCTDGRAINTVLYQQMRIVVRGLPDRQRLVMEGLIQELDAGLSESEAIAKIAQKHGLSEDAVRGLKKRAVANLRMDMGLGGHDA